MDHSSKNRNLIYFRMYQIMFYMNSVKEAIGELRISSAISGQLKGRKATRDSRNVTLKHNVDGERLFLSSCWRARGLPSRAINTTKLTRSSEKMCNQLSTLQIFVSSRREIPGLSANCNQACKQQPQTAVSSSLSLAV